MNINKVYELTPMYDARQSFYHKALVEITKTGKKLYSYETLVAEIKHGKAVIYGKYSQTTTRHQKEFLKQEGYSDNDIKALFKAAA